MQIKNVSFAETYIQFGSQDVRLYVICLFGIEIFIINGEEQYNGTILNVINEFCKDRNDYVLFLFKLFTLLEEEYNKLDNNKDRIEFLDVIRKNISKFKYRCSRQIGFNEVCSPNFRRILTNK